VFSRFADGIVYPKENSHFRSERDVEGLRFGGMDTMAYISNRGKKRRIVFEGKVHEVITLKEGSSETAGRLGRPDSNKARGLDRSNTYSPCYLFQHQ